MVFYPLSALEQSEDMLMDEIVKVHLLDNIYWLY